MTNLEAIIQTAEYLNERRIESLVRGATGLTILIEPVNRCNLACKYCAPAGYNTKNLPLKVMDKKLVDEIIEKVADFVLTYRVRGEILLHGYEPLLAGIEFFQYVQDKVQETGIRPYMRLGTQTNAVLIDDEWAKFFWRNNWSVGVSIDGPKEYHDANRVFPNGEGTYDQAMRGALLLKERFGRFPGVISVITKAHTRPSIDEAVQRYYKWLEEYDIRSANLHYASVNPHNPFAKEYAMTEQEIIEWFLKMYNLWKSKNDGRELLPFVGIVEAMVTGYPRPGLCFLTNGCWRVIGIDYKGIVHLCDRYSYILKHISQYKTLMDILRDPEMIKQAARPLVLRMYDKECSRCEYFHICQGGCAEEALNRYYIEQRALFGVPQWTRTQFCNVYKALFRAIEEDLRKLGVPLRFKKGKRLQILKSKYH